MVGEKIKILLIKRRMSMSDLAEKLDTTPQNLSNKFRRDNFRENEIRSISEALECKLDITFVMKDTGERV